MTKMESEVLVAPITALEFVGDLLLAGEGPNLAVYSLKDNGCNPQWNPENVLGGCTIHGIQPFGPAGLSVAESLLCVFGSKALVVLNLSISDSKVSLSKVCELREVHDWIWDVQWLRESSQTAANLGVALGHNAVALYDYRHGRVLKEIHCSEKCILYSAHFVGETWEELTLISGTVFNQLVIWKVSDQTNQEGRVEPRSRISGHKGVIFSIFYEEQRGILASASDDRSLRLWKVGDLTQSDSDVQCLLVLYGHQSRVWSVRLLPDTIVSIGEDSSCIVWSYNGDIIHNFKGHRGRGIRSIAVQDQLGWVATGGADSGIRLWQIKGRSSPSNGLLSLQFGSSQGIGAPKALAVVDSSCLVVMTDTASIYTYDFINKQWNFLLEDENYRSYGLLDVFKSTSGALCAIGNITGSIKIFSLSPVQTYKELKLHEGKVHSLTWVPPQDPSSDTYNLFSSGSNGVIVWLQVIFASGNVISVTEKCRFILPACKQRWHTSIAFLPKDNLIVCGDRRGSLMLYPSKVTGQQNIELFKPTSSLNDHASSMCLPIDYVSTDEPQGPQVQTQAPIFVLFGTHGKLGVTSVTYHDGFVYSSGRDGFYRQLKVEGAQLIMLRKLKSYKGMEWIERLFFTPDGNLEILGFHSTDFVIWSTRTSEKLHCVSCGGGHRSWSYKKEGHNEVFVYIKSGEIFAYQSQPVERLQSVLKESLHGRELTCVKYAGSIRNQNVDILITSSEDTTVSILSFHEDSKQISRLSTISDHLSTVKTLALARTRQADDDGFSTLLFTAGGRAEIEAYRIQVQGNDVSGPLSCQVIHLASHRLDEQWDRMKNKHKMVKTDPETRYMSLSALDEIGDRSVTTATPVFLAAACSDGSVRFFAVCEGSRRIVLAAETFYHQRCVLKVETFVHRAGNCSRVILCSAATDGRIALWDITTAIDHAGRMLEEQEEAPLLDLGSPRSTVSAHQCGINSLHVQKTADGHYMLASGGDDNSIRVCWLALDQGPEVGQTVTVQILKSFSASSAHAAHVTGLRILREDLVASASVDQRLTLWSIRDRGLQPVATRFCHVADVSEIDYWQRTDGEHVCVLCGQGLEVVTFKH